MKTQAVLILTLLLSYLGIAQQELLENDWKLHSMIIDGEHIDVPQFHPGNPEYDPGIQFFENSQAYEIFAIIDFNVFSDYGTILNADNFVLQKPSVTLGDCNYCELELQYLSIILFGDGAIGRTFDYEILDEPDNKKTLILTTPEGNTAIHGNYVLANKEINRNKITIHPNPTSDALFITSEPLQIETISIYDIYGKQVLNEVAPDHNIDVSGLPSSLYFLEVHSENNKTIKPFIKE
ncbi:MAG: T9SS type A sorting domain-containing protein [Bacteroidetes bacterium]|nr:T9SS type A sorting domain-containing protein [Bacteroidota bacterium]